MATQPQKQAKGFFLLLEGQQSGPQSETIGSLRDLAQDIL
jgi:hypothetical protein